MRCYNKPTVIELGQMQTESVFAAHSWNNGKGNQPDSNGNNGINYQDGENNTNKHQ